MPDPEFDPLGHQTPILDIEALKKLSGDISEGMMTEDLPLVWTAVEVGTWAGGTALALADCGVFDEVFCVDHWLGNEDDRLGDLAKHYGPANAFHTFCRNMGDRLMKTVFPCVGHSKTWAAIWPRKVGLVFIDASHKYEDVRDDILAWRPHVAPGGLLVCHDYGVYPGVTKAVEELMPGFERAGATLAYVRC